MTDEEKGRRAGLREAAELALKEHKEWGRKAVLVFKEKLSAEYERCIRAQRVLEELSKELLKRSEG